jgi:hypothetical protein
MENKKRPSDDGLWEANDPGIVSGLHDVLAGRTVLDRAFAALGFSGAVLGSRHSAAAGFLSHGDL